MATPASRFTVTDPGRPADASALLGEETLVEAPINEAEVAIEAVGRISLSRAVAGRLDSCAPGLDGDSLDLSQQLLSSPRSPSSSLDNYRRQPTSRGGVFEEVHQLVGGEADDAAIILFSNEHIAHVRLGSCECANHALTR
jgi:hypothetical protein